jgi:surfeit locus 1 family protein
VRPAGGAVIRFGPPLLLGLAGVAVLVALGLWQVERLRWKTAVIAEIEQRIAADPAPLPADPDPEADRYRPVVVEGAFGDGEIHVLTSRKDIGAGYRLIAPFRTDAGRTILVDRGFVPQDRKEAPRPAPPAPQQVAGNLHWPEETDLFTPENDRLRNIWFARDVAVMAAALGTEPVLLVARTPTGEEVVPLPVGTVGIPDNHLSYAITWFALAAVWAGMTLLWLWRIRQRDG